MKYQRAVHGNTAAQTEGLHCEACGQIKPVVVGGLSVGAKGFDYGEKHVHLGSVETEVFRILASNFGTLINRNRIHRLVYAADPNGGPDEKIMDVYLCKIRKKLKAAAVPLEIKTTWGVGYSLLALPVGN